jgi:hypothetical protein
MKHLLLVHGRSTKPAADEKLALVKQALVEGLRRIDADAARAIQDGDVAFTFVYYGDLNNREIVRRWPELANEMVQRGDAHYEPADSYAENLSELIARKTECHESVDYRELVSSAPNRDWLDRLFTYLVPVASALRISLWFARRIFPDLSGYFRSRKLASEVRHRLQGPLRTALRAGDEIALVTHSMGCVVAYDVLWKLSHMSEYQDVHDARVELWLTLGSPLSDPAVRSGLYDADESEDGRYPGNVLDWVNIGAHDDYVCGRRSVARAFAAMRELGRVRSISDRPRIYSFWTGRNGSNPHKLYGYLNHPQVAAELVRWINTPSRFGPQR